MGVQYMKRPLDLRGRVDSTAPPSSASVASILLGTNKIEAGGWDYTVVGSASSAGKTIPPYGFHVLLSSSTVENTPTVCYLSGPKDAGDAVEINCTLASSSAGFVLRTQSSALQYIGGSTTYDQVKFMYPNAGVRLIAASTLQWLCFGATTTASVGMALLGVSTS